ncbi:MAG: neutral zinc metallopeptidase [Rhodothermales bacterium]
MVQWRGRRRSSNVIDVRGKKGKAALGGGTLLIVLLGLLFGVDPGQLLALLGGGGGAATVETQTSGEVPPQDDAGEFVQVILADTEDTWGRIFQQASAQYREPELVLFTDRVQSACGIAGAATGPFYCPTDQRVYLDLGFFRQLQRMGASGDFAIAYVIAHEIGHHVQNLEGTLSQVQQMKQRLPQAQANELSVRTELQADCYAGVWAYYAETERDLLETGDVQEGIDAAGAVGDDRIQGDAASPDSFTHGTSAQRVEAFQSGFRSGDVGSCDTFADLQR